MNITPDKAFLQAVGLGLVAGMRTMYAPAVASHMYSRHKSRYLRHDPLSFMQSITASKIFKVLAAGELVGDKLPTAPNRTSAPGLIGRAISGMLVGSVVYRANGKPPVVGGLIGGAAAVASTFGCFLLRRAVVKSTKIPDPYIGAVEDVLVIAAGAAITQNA
ncbi:DUF4126 family protein [Mucilaginibacter terrenus]|uniref:DUF4126 family protein n=1 Tax=Mucilaginibacter terrenus TaxID=2482727 RepID=A0A3E2NUE6_9SPHI|nr:DUF4126 family protein [Mucilaginibacter terrenus]RFZ84634.1 DUF4126 family protein [Mucilaginibacter terrenus]